MIKSDSSATSLPASFKRLEKNDTTQTNDQWRTNLLKLTGSIAPLWTSYARANKFPDIDIKRPIPPMSPMESGEFDKLVNEYREGFANEANIPLSDTPIPSSGLIWSRYATLKALYEEELELYKIKLKNIHDTFPKENRKIFSLLEHAISDASVEDIRRTEQGAKAYEEQDALTFLNLAMETHDYIPTQISDRACQNAQTRFETFRQAASSPISDHINEFKRRLDHYCKIRGDKLDAVYKDYQLKGLLLDSLNKEIWGEWIRTCNMTRTMPATFKDVESALREEESVRILSNLKQPFEDILPSSSHATRVSTPPSTNFPCSTCGIMFIPKKKGYHRCPNCQKKLNTSKKKSQAMFKELESSWKERESSKPPSSSKSRSSSAHGTTVLTRDDPSPDDDPRFASFATIISHAFSSTSNDDDEILFDPASESHIIRSHDIGLNISNGPLTKIRGSVPGEIEVTTHALLGDLGTAPVSHLFSKNLISESRALAAGYHVIHDTRVRNQYDLIKEGCPPLTFHVNSKGTYSISVRDFKKHFLSSYDTNFTDIDRTRLDFTKKQRDRAALYRLHHNTCLAHAHDDKIIVAIENGILLNVPFTKRQVSMKNRVPMM